MLGSIEKSARLGRLILMMIFSGFGSGEHLEQGVVEQVEQDLIKQQKVQPEQGAMGGGGGGAFLGASFLFLRNDGGGASYQ